MEIPIAPPDIPDALDSSASDPQVQSIPPDTIQQVFSSSIDLISAPLGGHILARSDDFFAAADNLLTPTPPIRRPGHFVDTGAWYDGWETRRHNEASFDWVVVRLGVAAGRVSGVEIDTAFFNGNHAPAVSVEGTFCPGDDDDDEKSDPPSEEWLRTRDWTPILPRQDCGPSQRHAWKITTPSTPVTHVRLRMYPDGGIARFRLFGAVQPVFPASLTVPIDLAALRNGGRAVAWSDQHFGTAANLLLPGRGKDMGDGWETKRSRGEGHRDWVVVRLGVRGGVERVVVDTKDFKGNFPRAVEVKALDLGVGEGEGEPGHEHEGWREVVGKVRVGAHAEHGFEAAGEGGIKATHVMLTIFPDGGVKRLRVWGRRL